MKRASLLQEGLDARHTHPHMHDDPTAHSHTQQPHRPGSQARAHCRLPLAWESLMRSSLQAEAHAAISKALCWAWFIPSTLHRSQEGHSHGKGKGSIQERILHPPYSSFHPSPLPLSLSRSLSFYTHTLPLSLSLPFFPASSHSLIGLQKN